jgi:hypothetical protein
MICCLQNFNDWPTRNKLRNKSVSTSEKSLLYIVYAAYTFFFAWPARTLRAASKNAVAALAVPTRLTKSGLNHQAEPARAGLACC